MTDERKKIAIFVKEREYAQHLNDFFEALGWVVVYQVVSDLDLQEPKSHGEAAKNANVVFVAYNYGYSELKGNFGTESIKLLQFLSEELDDNVPIILCCTLIDDENVITQNLDFSERINFVRTGDTAEIVSVLKSVD